jgi:hypothetical protein
VVGGRGRVRGQKIPKTDQSRICFFIIPCGVGVFELFAPKNVAVCPIRTAFLWSLAALHGIRGAGGTQEGSGCTSGGALKKNRKEEARLKKKWGKYYDFFGIP